MLWFAAPLTRSHAFDARELLDELAQSKQGRATFVETRYLAVLDRPVKSSGILSFHSPARFEKTTLEPKPETLVLDGDTLTVTRGGRTSAVDLRSHAQVLSFVEAIRGVLLGDIQLLEHAYRIQMSGSEESWQMLLTPQDKQLATAIKQIKIGGGGGQVRTLEYAERGGDRSVMRIDPIPPSVEK